MEKKYLTLACPYFDINYNDYLKEGDFKKSRIRQDKNVEAQKIVEYQGRELFEMIQNADDEKSPRIQLELRGDRLFIRNWGDCPFTEEGLISILRAYMSSKSTDGHKKDFIGCKGLGFRSLLNWGDSVIIRSNGVCCEFSKEIAKEKWEELKKNFKDEEVVLFEKETDCPLPLLSVLKQSYDGGKTNVIYPYKEVTDKCTTEIEVQIKNPKISEDISQKLRELSGEILLFLKHTIQIDIIIPDSYSRTIQKVSTEALSERMKRIVVRDSGNDAVWLVCHEERAAEFGNYEVAAAYSKNLPKENKLFSFFPTEETISLPCVLHGTFIMDDSRNRIPPKQEENLFVFDKVGEILLELSVFLAENSEEVSWNPYDIINLSRKDAERFPSLAAALKQYVDNRIFPTFGGYATANEYLNCSDSLSEWILSCKMPLQGSLCRILIPGSSGRFSDDRLFPCRKNVIPDSFGKDLEELTKALLKKENVDYGSCAILVSSLLDSNLSFRPSILFDDLLEIIPSEERVYILRADESIIPPTCLGMRIVSRQLVNSLKALWQVDERGVTKMLRGEFNNGRGLADASDCDMNTIKERFASWSKDASEEQLTDGLNWLFKQKSATLPLNTELFGRDGLKHQACSLLLYEEEKHLSHPHYYDDRWYLAGTIEHWGELLGATSVEETKDFFYNEVGVARFVPCSFVYFGIDKVFLFNARVTDSRRKVDDYYFHNDKFRNSYLLDNNYSLVPELEFLEQLPLEDCIGLLASEGRVISSLENRNLKYTHHGSDKVEMAKTSFSAYKLGLSDHFVPVKSFALNDNIGITITPKEICDRFKIDTHAVISVLMSLGAKLSASELSLDCLYSLLKNPPTGPDGIVSFYRSIRNAIINNPKAKDDEDLTVYTNTIDNLYAVKDGKVEKTPRDQVFYWDNNILPQGILERYPRLHIGGRVGEDSVQRVFGIKLAKEIVITTVGTPIEAKQLQSQLLQHLNENLKYILAIRCSDMKDSDLQRESKRAKRSLSHIRIYTSCDYQLSVDQNTDPHHLGKGDILAIQNRGDEEFKEFCICFPDMDWDTALHTPAFCFAVEELFSILFKLTGRTDYISTILKNSKTENEYLIKHTVSENRLDKIVAALGISPVELSVWKQKNYDLWGSEDKLLSTPMERKRFVEQALNIKLSSFFDEGLPELDRLEPEGRRNLLLDLDIDNAKCFDPEKGLREFYFEQFKDLRINYDSSFCGFARDNCSESYESFVDHCEQYRDDSWLSSLADSIKFEVLEDDAIKDRFHESACRKFNFDITVQYTPVQPRYEYVEILKQLSDYDRERLSFDVLSLTYFPGQSARFDKRIKDFLAKEHPESEPVEHGNENLPEIKYTKTLPSTSLSSQNSGNSHRKQQSAFKSSEQQHRLGKNAERLLRAAFEKDPDYKIVSERSSNLGGPATDDSSHYDMKYTYKGGPVRFLEIKARAYDSFFMSAEEYRFAKDHSSIYDIALVSKEEINIIKAPFENDNFRKVDDTYKIFFQLDQSEEDQRSQS